MLQPSIPLLVSDLQQLCRELSKLTTVLVMIAVARNVAEGCSSLKAGKWERSKFTGIELKGKVLGVVGAGKGR